MQRYANRGGGSNVVGYEIGADWIEVKFEDGSIYRYDYQSAGASNIALMKQLAGAGRGLNSFIGRVVKRAYSARLR